MLTAACVGRLKEAKIEGNQTRCLGGKVEVFEQGFGRNADKVFTRTVKFAMFGKSIDDLLPKLRPGVLVSVVGKPEAEGWAGRDGTIKGTLKITGQISIVLDSAEPSPAAPQHRATQRYAPPDAPRGESDPEDMPNY